MKHSLLKRMNLREMARERVKKWLEQHEAPPLIEDQPPQGPPEPPPTAGETPTQGPSKKRERREIGRPIFALAVWLGFAIAMLFIPVNIYIKFGIWAVLFGVSFPYLTVTIPEITGLVTLNWFTGTLRSFDQGLHFRYPWDIVREQNFFSLELVSKDFEETFAAKDGPMMHVKASFQYKPSAKRLDKFLAVDDTVIQKGFTDVISGILSEVIGSYSVLIGGVEVGAEAVRREVDKVSQEVLKRFEEGTIKVENETTTPRKKLEDQYGIDFQRFVVSDIDFSPDYQEMRSAKARAERFAEITTNLKERLQISGKDAANIALVEQKKAEKKIFEIEGLEGAAGNIAGTIAKLFQKGKGGE